MIYLLLVLGFIVLVKGADYFVEGASHIARKLNVSGLVIGLTIIAFGTSAPEAAVSITSALNGQNELAIGNVIGSNIFNILIVVGVAAMIYPLQVDRNLVVKEIPMTVLGSIVLFILAADPIFQSVDGFILSRGDGLILLAFFILFMYSVFRSAVANRKDCGAQEDEQMVIMSSAKSSLLTIGGIVAVVVGGQMVVTYATQIAAVWGMSESMIGLTIVAVGTSLPELVTSVIAAKKGKSDMALGNVIGSNLFNIFFVLGSASIITPLTTVRSSVIDMGFMIGTIIFLFVAVILKDTIGRLKGSCLLGMYIIYMTYLMV